MRLVLALSRTALGVLQGERLARGVETFEPLRHLVGLVADPERRGAQPKPLRREPVQMVEDANEGVHRRRLAGVDLAAEEVERPLEPGDLEERIVVGGIGVAALKLLANDLLHPADAQALRRGDGADRLPANEASENALRALAPLRTGADGFDG